MGLFSFGSKEKKDEEQPKRAQPEPITERALMRTFNTDDLDYLFEAYAPGVWANNKMAYKHAKAARELCEAIIEGETTIEENQITIEKNLQQDLSRILSLLNDISRRLDALEQSREITERTR